MIQFIITGQDGSPDKWRIKTFESQINIEMK